MIMLRRGQERLHARRRRQEAWLTFDPNDHKDPLAKGFGSLKSLSEGRLLPSASIPRHIAHRDVEIVTYVREGALKHVDSSGRCEVIHAGEFRRTSAGCGIRQSETNASRTNAAHVFQISIRPSTAGLAPSHEQKRFCAAERRGAFCLVGSPDGRRGSLRVHQDALMYSAILDAGHHVVHELAPGRRVWLHLVHGEVVLGDVVLTTGDGAAVTAERAVSLTARGETELLLLDLGEPPTRSFTNGDVL
jgi:quercetin 2,3-dioxygenase